MMALTKADSKPMLGQRRYLSVEEMYLRSPTASMTMPFVNRLAVLCKDGEGRIGLKLRSIDKGLFVCLVVKGSAAAMGGLRFGDQVLMINSVSLAGIDEERVHKMLRDAPINNIVLGVKDRPFERTLTLRKDATGHLGFVLEGGQITAIAVDSSAAKNGLLTRHQLLEVNGVNVVGLSDKEVSKKIQGAGKLVSITIMPSYIYKQLVCNVADKLVKENMDHSHPFI